MPGPLHGYRILDLTTVISGPFATMLLADQGADVIKVEGVTRPDHARGAGHGENKFTATFLNNNRNKRSLALDLKSNEGREILLKLAATALPNGLAPAGRSLPRNRCWRKMTRATLVRVGPSTCVITRTA